MPHEQIPSSLPDLTPDQLETALFFLQQSGLEDVADVVIEEEGHSSSVLYALGSCGHFKKLTRTQTREAVMAKIAAQQANRAT